MKKFLTLSFILSLTACGTVGNVFISDQSLQEKAAFALNTTSDKVTISNRSGGVDDVRFVAKVGKQSYQCYITTVAGAISSDAICSGSSSVKSCDALSKKAGRCN